MNQSVLSSFFDQFHRIRKQHAGDFNLKLERFFLTINSQITEYKRYRKLTDRFLSPEFNTFNFFKPDENCLSDILADLLDANGTHGQGVLFQKMFIAELHNSFNVAGFDSIDILNVHREIWANGRIDVFLENRDHAIIIENKPFAGDQKDQLIRYETYVKLAFHHVILVYISNSNRSPGNLSNESRIRLDGLKSENKLIYFNYQKLRVFLESCSRYCESDRYRIFLKEFVQYIENVFNTREELAYE